MRGQDSANLRKRRNEEGRQMNNPCANCPVKEECSNIDQEMSCEQAKERIKHDREERRKEVYQSQKG